MQRTWIWNPQLPLPAQSLTFINNSPDPESDSLLVTTSSSSSELCCSILISMSKLLTLLMMWVILERDIGLWSHQIIVSHQSEHQNIQHKTCHDQKTEQHRPNTVALRPSHHGTAAGDDTLYLIWKINRYIEHSWHKTNIENVNLLVLIDRIVLDTMIHWFSDASPDPIMQSSQLSIVCLYHGVCLHHFQIKI